MCRMLAICGTLEADAVLDALTKFGALAEYGVVPKNTSPGHKDGWGFAAYNDANIIFYEKNPKAALDDPAFASAVAWIANSKSSLIIGHLRKASVGSTRLENTHPFILENWAFCHNGSIGVKGDMAGLELGPDFRNKRQGQTDSETLFLYVLQLLSDEQNPNSAIVQKKLLDAISLVRTTRDYTALNILFTNGKTLFAIREVNEKNERVMEGNLCDSYYTLFFGKSASQKEKIICSQKLDLKGVTWSEIPNYAMVVIDVEQGQEKIVAI